jgi:hypothetical protein
MRVGDFELRGGRVILRKTGNSARIDRRLLAEVASWVAYYVVLNGHALWRNLARRPRPLIWFTPDVPHPRYLVRSAAIHAGIRVASSPERASAAFFFEDSTRSAPVPAPHLRAFNFRCTDISKGHVAAVFARVFGYPLAIDPAVWRGPAVEKSEANGAHDGRIVQCPCEPVAGKVYQRLIDTVDADGLACDLRTHVVGGRILAVWVKHRPAADRFLPPNLTVVRRRPEEIFTAAERASILAFVAAMGADWAALDILRDRDRRIYVVDVNKTDAGPIIALPLREKMASTALLGEALLAMIGAATLAGAIDPAAATRAQGSSSLAIERSLDP